ncbi:MAG TPA: peptidoglycan DD-metalloendopeptidase family protein [Acidimicrobiia bacterium]
MRFHVRFLLVRRVLLAAVAVALLTPPAAAGAASDPLAAAVARVTAAEKADNRATAAYDAAQTRYYELQDEQASTQRSILTLTAQQQRLAALGRMRAVVAYKRGSLVLDDILGSGSDILDAARRAEMLDDANARGDDVIAQLDTVTGDLDDHESTLHDEVAHAKAALGTMNAQQHDAERALATAGRAERELRAQLAARRRLQQLSAILATTRAEARSGNASGSGAGRGTAGQIIVRGTWVCPVQGPVSFTDTFGAARSGGRRHQGNDVFSPGGTPLVAVTDGTAFFQGDPLGGNAAYVQGHDGNTYYYAHLNDYVGGARAVTAGELIGHVGNTGDAAGGPTHLHFEIRPGGPNGRAIDPYPTLAAHCG